MNAMKFNEKRELSASRRRIVDEVVKKNIAKNIRECERDLSVAFCYVLHNLYGFGEERLTKAVQEFGKTVEELLTRYEMPAQDTSWLCEEKLKKAGYDVDKIIGDGICKINYTITE